MPDRNQASEYLGDGVYAQFMPETNQLCLMVSRCDNPFDEKPNIRIERVALEPLTFEALVRFAAVCWPEEFEEPTV